MDDVQLANWYAGDRDKVEVCRVFIPVLCRELCLKRGAAAWLSDYTLTKTAYIHKEIDFRDYQRLPEIFSDGFVLPGNQKRTVEAIHVDLSGADYRFWHACLKGTARDEAFVSMFHRGHFKEVRRRYRQAHRRGTLLRDHKNAAVRRLLGRTAAVA